MLAYYSCEFVSVVAVPLTSSRVQSTQAVCTCSTAANNRLRLHDSTLLTWLNTEQITPSTTGSLLGVRMASKD